MFENDEMFNAAADYLWCACEFRKGLNGREGAVKFQEPAWPSEIGKDQPKVLKSTTTFLH